jgi:hypothetical protein
MGTDTIYKPSYVNSWALIIGINQYRKAPPLGYACNDATALAEILALRFHFPTENIALLTDESATRERILGTFLEYANGRVEPDDRIVVFFAGHGHTVTGRRGEVGYLVPVDGSTDQIATLIRWDDLTRNAELIPAKHILFVMDACYGGLALTRYTPPGSMRFLKDMLQRYSRQVLTAGKANETVADAGGPRAGHSIFTGHLLDALEGKAATPEGVLTANGVMAYVYDRVATDYQSRQTPHYGFVDGDGDFVFDLTPLTGKLEGSNIDKDVLIEIPPTAHKQPVHETAPSTPDLVKEYLSEARYRIRLDDLVTEELRKTLFVIGDNNVFPVQTADVSPVQFAERLRKYEHAVSELQTILVLLAKWGGDEHRSILEKMFSRIGEVDTSGGGKVVWLGLRWYPIQLLLYAGGIASLAGGNYANLSAIVTARVAIRHSRDVRRQIIIPAVDGMVEVGRTNILKTLPGHERNYVPLSEYMFKVLQPPLEDLLFLGTSYEPLFDRFEVLYALTYADLTYDEEARVWGPLGRFGWKYSSRVRDTNPFTELVAEADQMKEKWAPLNSGLFQGSYQRFKKIADGFEELLQHLNWY